MDADISECEIITYPINQTPAAVKLSPVHSHSLSVLSPAAGPERQGDVHLQITGAGRGDLHTGLALLSHTPEPQRDGSQRKPWAMLRQR